MIQFHDLYQYHSQVVVLIAVPMACHCHICLNFLALLQQCIPQANILLYVQSCAIEASAGFHSNQK